MSCIYNLSYLGSWSYIVRLPLQTKQRKRGVGNGVEKWESLYIARTDLQQSDCCAKQRGESSENKPGLTSRPSNSSSERATKSICRLLGSTQEAETFLGYLVIRPHSRALHNCPKSGAAQKSTDKWMDLGNLMQTYTWYSAWKWNSAMCYNMADSKDIVLSENWANPERWASSGSTLYENRVLGAQENEEVALVQGGGCLLFIGRLLSTPWKDEAVWGMVATRLGTI